MNQSRGWSPRERFVYIVIIPGQPVYECYIISCHATNANVCCYWSCMYSKIKFWLVYLVHRYCCSFFYPLDTKVSPYADISFLRYQSFLLHQYQGLVCTLKLASSVCWSSDQYCSGMCESIDCRPLLIYFTYCTVTPSSSNISDTTYTPWWTELVKVAPPSKWALQFSSKENLLEISLMAP